jgi:hypothetical protein
MRRLLRWAAWTIAAIALLALLAVAYVYVASERILRRTYTIALTPITLPDDSTALIEGERLLECGVVLAVVTGFASRARSSSMIRRSPAL